MTLEQARNGTASSPVSPVNFQTGNLGTSQSHYVESFSTPFRLVIENVATGAHTAEIEWDVRNSGVNAYDYITHYDRLQPHTFTPAHAQETVDPLNGLTGPFGSPSTFAIPAPSSTGSPVPGQPTASFNALPANERVMTIWNGSISSLSYLSQGNLTANQSATSMTINFTATSSTVVIAWGGHIADRLDWGNGNSAGNISGSPFHMRLNSFDGSGGNQDRSLAAGAVTVITADLRLTKTVNNNTPNVGSQIVYTITVTNDGPDPASGVTVKDVLPAGLSYVSSSPSQGSFDNGTSIWTVGTLAKNASATLQITATVTASGPIVNTAQVQTSNEFDPDSTPGNDNANEDDQSSVTITGQPLADLSLVKSVNNPTAQVGSTVTFTIAVTNNGPSTATNVSIGDVIPSGFTYVANSISGGSARSDASAPTLSWTIASLASGASTNLTFQAVVNATGNYTNVAQVTAADQADPNSTPNNQNGAPYENDEDDATVTPSAVADLSLVKSVNNPTAQVGSTVTFTIAVTNNGPSTATNVSVGDVIPSGFTYVANSISGGTTRSAANAPTLSWTINSLANGATTNLTFQAVVNATGNYTNVAQVTAADQNDPDSAPNNENGAPYEDDEDDAKVTPAPSNSADLSLQKSVNTPTAAVGSTVTFTIAVTNSGPSTATNVRVNDVIPSGFTYVSNSIAGGSSRSASNLPTLRWTISSLASGATVNLSFKAVVKSSGVYKNVAQVVASDQPDPDSAPNNENGAPYEDDEDDAIVTPPSAQADLSLQKSVNNPTAAVGSTVTFTIAVTNNGPSTATNVSIGDVIPSGFAYVANSISGGTTRSDASAPTLSWTIASIANGATVNLTYQAVVNATGNYTNVAQVTASDQGDPNSTPNNQNGAPYENDEDDATVTPSAVADLSLVKSVNNPTAQVGSTVTFTIAVTNNGPSTATNVSIGDVIPSGFAYVANSISGGTTRSDASAPTLSWTIASIANGATVNLTYQAVVNATGNYTNVAQVTAADQPDPDSAPNNENGAPYEDDEDDATVTPPAACAATYMYCLSDEEPEQLTRVDMSQTPAIKSVVVDEIIFGGPAFPGATFPSWFEIGDPIKDEAEAMARDANTGITYMISNRRDVSTLLILNLQTGVAYSVGSTYTTAGQPVDDINSIAFNNQTGELYGITVADNRLLKINTTTAQVTMYSNPITTKNGVDLEGASFDHSVTPAQLYVISEYGDGEIFRINLTTGLGTQVGTTMLGMEGIEFAKDGTMYAVNNNSHVYVINRTTYVATLYALNELIDGEGLVLEECVSQTLNGGGALTQHETPQPELIAATAAIPREYALEQNYPNPFNPTTRIAFSLPEAGEVRLTIFDLSGRVVRTLLSQSYAAGRYEVDWDGTGDEGEKLAGGFYLYRVQVNNFIAVRRMLLMK